MIKIQAYKAKSFIEKSIGLIKKSGHTKALFFETRFGIHTFGLSYPIDVVILDKNNIVVKVSLNLKKNRIFIWNPFYSKVLELPQGTIEKHAIKKGDRIELVESKVW